MIKWGIALHPSWQYRWWTDRSALSARIQNRSVGNALSSPVAWFDAAFCEKQTHRQRIVRMRENGVRDIEIAPFSFDLSGYISASGQAFGWSHPYYYGVDSIHVVE